ncbi:MAG: alkaline phosphatase [Gammaproteobacteria bacterium]|nr:MAG: alkaline phosphatase [Gammaproteobacteria bacterium]
MRGLFGTPLLCTLLLSALAAPLALQAENASTPAEKHPPANVILFIGDGMDEHQITLARNYLYGANGSLAMERLPVRSSAKVQTLREEDPRQYRYVADSANTASTLSTGELTSMGRIATSAGDDQDMPTVLEAARQAGLATGLVTTANLTDATPAAFAAHTAHRNCQNPGDMHKPISYLPATQQCLADHQSQGGKGSIAEQLLAAGIDVLLGGGKKEFARVNSHASLEKIAASHGYHLLQQREKLLAYRGKKPLLGLFASSHLPVEWIGDGKRRAAPITFNLIGEPVFPAPFNCLQNPGHRGTPTLEEMTHIALNRLSGNSAGFFLMVEGASIDKQAHKRNPCGEIGELQAFDRAVALGQAFASKQTNTLIIVTADHGQAGQIIPLPEYYQSWGNKQYPPGHYAVLKTRSGELMAVSYATNAPPQGKSELHTGVNVPVFLQGIAAAEVPALMDQRTINHLMRRHLGLESQVQ